MVFCLRWRKLCTCFIDVFTGSHLLSISALIAHENSVAEQNVGTYLSCTDAVFEVIVLSPARMTELDLVWTARCCAETCSLYSCKDAGHIGQLCHAYSRPIRHKALVLLIGGPSSVWTPVEGIPKKCGGRGCLNPRPKKMG